MILSIDPSINKCGWAVYLNKELKDYGLIESKVLGKTGNKDFSDYIKKSIMVVDELKCIWKKYRGKDKSKKDYLVFEVPEYWAVPGFEARESGALFKLVFLCGRISSISRNFISVTPSGWKGQMPKKVVANRLQRYFTDDIDFVKMDNNIMDGIAIGYYFIHKRV